MFNSWYSGAMQPLILLLLIYGLFEVILFHDFFPDNSPTIWDPWAPNVYWKSLIASIQTKQIVVKSCSLMSGVCWTGELWLRHPGGEDSLLELWIHWEAHPGPDLAHPADSRLDPQHHLLSECFRVQGKTTWDFLRWQYFHNVMDGSILILTNS